MDGETGGKRERRKDRKAENAEGVRAVARAVWKAREAREFVT
jgi:hypothetical protein